MNLTLISVFYSNRGIIPSNFLLNVTVLMNQRRKSLAE